MSFSCKTLWHAPFFVALMIALASCSDEPANQGLVGNTAFIQLSNKAIQQTESIRQNHTAQAIEKIEQLHGEINIFLDKPDQTKFLALRESWQSAHKAFIGASFTEYNTSENQINEQQPVEPVALLLQRIDAWPVQPGFLDSLPDYPHSGIVNDVTLPISAQSLIQQNQLTDASEVSLGFHALAVLLFIKDFKDFVLTDDPIVLRRREALSITVDLLETDTDQFFALDNKPGEKVVTEKNNPEDTLRQLQNLLANIQARVAPLFAEASELGADTSISHATRSTLQTEINLLAEITGPETALQKIFMLLDKPSATNYQRTLEQARQALKTPEDVQLPKLSLLCAALGHQLADISQLASNPAKK